MRTANYTIKLLLLIVNIILFSPVINGQIFLQGSHDSTFTEYFRRNSGGWTAGDATLSVPLPDGRTVWLFGDSYIVNVDTTDNTLPCLFQVRNCMMVQDAVDPSLMTTYIDEGQTGVLRSTFKLAPDDPSPLWPGHGFTDADTVLIYLDHIDNSTLENLGIYIARLQLPDLTINSIRPLPDYGGIQVGRAVITDTARGYRYIYGNKVDWIVWEPFVARTLIGTNIEAPYQFYTGTGWSFNPYLAAPVSAEFVSPGFSVFMMNNKYYMLTQENGLLTCSLGREIYIMESDKPWGPFINKQLVYTIEYQFNGYYTHTYNAQCHPSFTENNELLVSYNVNDAVDTTEPYICPSQCKDLGRDRLDADTYRPKFIRVPILSTSTESSLLKTHTVVIPNPVSPNFPFKLDGIPVEYDADILEITGKLIKSYKSMGNSNYLMSPSKKGMFLITVHPRNLNPYTIKLLVQ
ncbi:MAG: DUF5005 domain-containing protein [Chloroflexota bacterium]